MVPKTIALFVNYALQIYSFFISPNISKKNKRYFFFSSSDFVTFALLFMNLQDPDKRYKP